MLRFSRFVCSALLVGPLSAGCAEDVELGELSAAAAGSTTGAGATGSGGGSSSTGPGGSGGSSPSASCVGLTLSGTPIGVDPVFTAEQGGPVLSLTPPKEPGQDAAAPVALAFVERDPLLNCLPSAACPSDIANASFSAWGTWPASLGGTASPAKVTGEPIAASPGATALSFALLWDNPPGLPETPEAMAFKPMIFDPAVPPKGNLVSFDLPGRPLFVSAGAAKHLVGYEADLPAPFEYLRMHVMEGSVDSFGPLLGLSCASEPLAADAVRTDGGWIVATSSGRGFDGCLLDDGIPGPPQEIQVSFVSDGPTAQWSLGSVLPLVQPESPDRVANVRLVPRSDGAWLVYQFQGDNALVMPPIMAARIDATGKVVDVPHVPVSPEGSGGPVAVASLGDKLAVGWVSNLDPSAPTLVVQIVGETGTLLGSVSFSEPGWYSGTGVSLLGSPSGDQLLVAWASYVNDGAPAAVHVARYDCLAE